MNSPALQVSLQEMLIHLASRHNLDLRGYKYSTLRRRTQRRMDQLRVADYDAYLHYIDQHPAEVSELLDTILINVTKFFRDPAAWQVIREEVLPMLFADHQAGEPFKVWCAGCSTGEEAYTIALLIAENLGSQLKSHDIKIYATDQDQTALQVARKGVYNVPALTYIPQEFHKDLAVTGDTFRLHRDIRRLVIFGCGNIVADAPISGVNLLICRNLLIYFDSSAQRHILKRLRYAVKPKGVLFLGKSESQLNDSPHFIIQNSRWRIFQRTEVQERLERPKNMSTTPTKNDRLNERAQEELAVLKAYHHTLLETIEPGIIILDSEDTVVTENDASRRLWQSETRSLGGNIHESVLMSKCPELGQHLQDSRSGPIKTVRFDYVTGANKNLMIAVRPIESRTSAGSLLGTLIYMEDVGPRQDLQHTVEELQTTAEELQSTNEELETTNEELQSTNEELETTNEELQSTNEELETTNEELKSLNEELEDINEELGLRSKELNVANLRYIEMVERMPWPMFVITEIQGTIGVYNTAVQRLFGFATPSREGMTIKELPMSPASRTVLVEHLMMAAKNGQNVRLEEFELLTNVGVHKVRLHINPMRQGTDGKGAMVMFEPLTSKSAVSDRGSMDSQRGGSKAKAKVKATAKSKPKSRKR